ncbi:hypothetical protein [Mycobacterium sp.]|jgi:hypothetical protein|nr:hypothetical protein [Mycobacterium sp.]
MKYLEVHGDRVAYRDAGAGEALLLIQRPFFVASPAPVCWQQRWSQAG